MNQANEISSGQVPAREEFVDAVRRHIIHVLGFDYGLIDLVAGAEIVNLVAFSTGGDRQQELDSLKDEHQQPLTVAHTLIAQKVKQTQKAWTGRVFSQSNTKAGYPYAIVPIMDDSPESPATVKGLIRVVSLDEGRTIDEKDLSTLSLFCQHLSSHLLELPAGVFKQEKQAPWKAAEVVLVVNPNRHIRRRISRVLQEKYNVIEDETGTKCLDILDNNHVDLIVLDSETRGASGYALCRILKESPKWKHIPVILVTSESNVQGKIDGLNAGAEDCLSESCHEAELLARASASLHLRKAERDLSVQQRLLEDYAQRLEEEFEKARLANANFARNNKMLEQRNQELHQAKLREEIMHAQAQLLTRISDIIRRSFNFNENIGTMLEQLADFYSLDCCFAILPCQDDPLDAVRSEYATSDEYKLMERDEDLAILNVFQSSFRVDQVLVVSDVSRDRSAELFRKAIHASYPLRSLFYVPVSYEEKLLGLIGGHKCETEANWSQDNKSFFKSVADQVAIGLTNARLYARIERQATSDGLTGLFNHRTGQEKLTDQARLAERYQRNLAVVMIDVDHFKTINDSYGHPAGDAVLKTVARLIRSNCRDVDIPVRYGGEEFLLILPEVNQEGAQVVAERIRRHVENEVVHHDDLQIHMTASLGVASYPEDAKNHSALLDLADKALYMSKRLGRNQVHTANDLLLCDLDIDVAPEKQASAAGKQPEQDQAAHAGELDGEVVEMVKALASALYSKSEYNKEHHLETARFAELLAKVVGLSQQQIEQIRVASLLHDLGVLSIPEEVLNKPGLVTEQEMDMIAQHPALGAQLLRPVQALKEICDIVENHHECWDGSGYPHGLKGEEIPLPARIVSIVDSYHAMICNRPYRPALSRQQAKTALKNGAGTQWDPFLVDCFLALLDNMEAGNI